MIEAWFDGCCEPVNPGGTASYGVVIHRNGDFLCSEGRIVGSGQKMSNNVAEYAGFIRILELLAVIEAQENPIMVRGDSKLVINQVFGRWKIRDGLYVPLAMKAKKMAHNFPKMIGGWIPREQNGLADKLSKSCLTAIGIKLRLQKEAQP